MSTTATHTEHEDNPWTIEIGDHPARADSPTYRRSRKYLMAVVEMAQPWFEGDGPYQDHHGGGVWLRDNHGWFMVKNLAGIEWSAQFCADPARVELLRVNALRLVEGFPLTVDGYRDEIGMTEQDLAILYTQIGDADGVAAWTDSLWNASVPLPAGLHTGVVSDHQPAGGDHHYPAPITDIQRIKRPDFNLWVVDPHTGHRVAVVPVARHGSGDGRVMVAYAPPVAGAPKVHTVLPAEHHLAMAAFRLQGSN